MGKIFSMFMMMILMVYTINLDAQVNQDWKWAHPGPQGNTLRWVKMIDANNWYACGYAGTFMKTSNAGASWTIYTNAGGWQPSYYGQGRILYSGWFFNANTGLVCGSSGWVARTTNAGVSWDSVASPTANALYGIHFENGNTGYIGGAAGTVLKSTNAGLNWSILTTGITTTVYNIFAGLGYVLAPTTAGNIRYSTDAGTTWATSYTGTSFTVYDVNFIDAFTGMACGSSGNIKLTTNAGLNWTSVNSASTSTQYELFSTSSTGPVTFKLNEGFVGTTFPPTGWSVNGTATTLWSRATVSGYGVGVGSAKADFYNTSSGYQNLVTAAFTPTTAGDSLKFFHAYATYSTEVDSLVIFTSTNSGTTFTQLIGLAGGVSGPLVTAPPTTSSFTPTSTQWATKTYALPIGTNTVIFKGVSAYGNNLYLDSIRVSSFAPSTTASFYVVGDSYGIYKTDNYGTNWALLSYDATAPWTSTHYTLDVSGNNIFAGGAYGMMEKSTNAGTNFAALHHWLSPGAKYGVWAQYNNGLVIVTGAPGSAGATFDQVLRSTNGGTNWSIAPFGSSATFYDIAMLNATTGFMCGSAGNLRKTTNAGLNWDSVPGPFGTNNLRRIEFVNANTGYLFQMSGATNGAWKTTNGGSVWDSLPGIGSETRGYASSFINANIGYVGNYTPKLMKTTNGGVNWTVLTNTPMGSGYIYGVKFFNADSGYACGTAAGRLCRTTNGGTSFDTVPQPFAASLYTMRFYTFKSGWIFGSNGFAGRTTDAGITWMLHNTSGSTPYGCYMTNADSGFVVGTSGYVHKISKQPLTGAEWTGTIIPTEYYLRQNYPNPFNPTTTIEFALPKQGLVSLKIYDVAGREITSALNTMLNPGIVKYTFNGASYASGVYFYRLIVDGKMVDTKKMVLVK